MMVAEISAMHWLWNPEAFTSKSIARWFSEYLNMLNSNSVTDLQAIMCKIEEIYDQSKREHKSGLLSFYFCIITFIIRTSVSGLILQKKIFFFRA